MQKQEDLRACFAHQFLDHLQNLFLGESHALW